MLCLGLLSACIVLRLTAYRLHSQESHSQPVSPEHGDRPLPRHLPWFCYHGGQFVCSGPCSRCSTVGHMHARMPHILGTSRNIRVMLRPAPPCLLLLQGQMRKLKVLKLAPKVPWSPTLPGCVPSGIGAQLMKIAGEHPCVCAVAGAPSRFQRPLKPTRVPRVLPQALRRQGRPIPLFSQLTMTSRTALRPPTSTVRIMPPRCALQQCTASCSPGCGLTHRSCWPSLGGTRLALQALLFKAQAWCLHLNAL